MEMMQWRRNLFRSVSLAFFQETAVNFQVIADIEQVLTSR